MKITSRLSTSSGVSTSRASVSWKKRLHVLIDRLRGDDKQSFVYLVANVDAIQRAASGMGPDSDKVDSHAGARVVVNLSSVHVPAFCAASKNKEATPYKNAYDLDAIAPAMGANAPSDRRRLVDAALPLSKSKKQTPASTYFGTVELHGAGIRFYGDICLVLKAKAITSDTVLLDRNSYDVLRSPAREEIDRQSDPKAQASARSDMLRDWRGLFKRDGGAMVAIKVLGLLGARERRLTTGQISEAVRDDEDYIEVLRHGSFAADELQEARISAADAAHDAFVGTRLRGRPVPRLEALIWRDRRGRAERALRSCGVPVVIVTTGGRTRS